MNPFPDTIRLEDAGMHGASRVFRTLERFRFYSPSLGWIEVPAGTLTDGASIPRIFWNILSPFGSYFKAALPHDYLYSAENKRFTRQQADTVLREGMIAAGVPWHKRAVIYYAVRAFGWRFFQGKKS